jgi:tetratricopeptide (TPR) repeat protein
MNAAVPMTAEQARAQYAQAVDALNRGDWTQAQQLSMDLLRRVPEHAGVYFVAGVAARELLQVPLAMQCLERATQLNPQRADYLAQFARALSQASMPTQAIAVADRALALAPSDPVSCDVLGVVYSQANVHAKASRMFRRVVELQPANPGYRFNYATSLIVAGDVEGAEAQLQECLAQDPRFWKANLTLAHLRRQTPGSNHVEALQVALVANGNEREPRQFLNLALAKELEDLGDHPAAFAHLVAGKHAGGEGRDYTSDDDRALFDTIIESFPGRQPATSGFASDEPIFVIGMPRTGTTLLDRILSSHTDVHSVGELQNFGVALKRASGSRTRPMLDAETMRLAAQADWSALGRRYIESTRPATGTTPRFVDKLPHNFLYAGYIANALPGAKIVCIRRNPMDTCLSNFRQLFALNSRYYDYSFDLLDTGRYYLQFDRLMAFWREAFPDRILEIRYEDLVDAQEPTTRRLLASCGLEWQDACLAFERNAAPVATASAVQVREPIHRAHLGRWKRYAPQLQELRELLEAGGVTVED